MQVTQLMSGYYPTDKTEVSEGPLSKIDVFAVPSAPDNNRVYLFNVPVFIFWGLFDFPCLLFPDFLVFRV